MTTQRDGDGTANPGGGPAKPMKPGSEAPAGTLGTGEAVCPVCKGTGIAEQQAGGRGRCPNCAGTGIVTEGIGGA